MVGIESEALDNLLSRAGQFTHASTPQDISNLGHAILPGTGQHPQHS